MVFAAVVENDRASVFGPGLSDDDERHPQPQASRPSTAKGRRKNRRHQRKEDVSDCRSDLFHLVTSLKEDHGRPIYCVAVNSFLPEDMTVFATVAANRLTVYRCADDLGIELLQAFADCSTDEELYCCTWLYDLENSTFLVACAGKLGIIHILIPSQGCSKEQLVGHGHSVNELCGHPSDLDLLFSASKDYTLRLWNVKTGYCVAIFGGAGGHRDEVLSLDMDLEGTQLASSGMDHSIRVWRLSDNEELQDRIRLSHTYKEEVHLRRFPTLSIHYPDCSTRDVHTNYVDCVRWFGSLVLSKSCEGAIYLWKYGTSDSIDFDPNETSAFLLKKFKLPVSKVWWIRFGLDSDFQMLAAGNQEGKIFLWPLTDLPRAPPTVLSHSRCTALVRHVAFSINGNTLISVSEDATVSRWDRS